MDALVLSGGSIKGAWQAGAIDRVYESGYRPQIITGTSVGALNAAHLAAYPGPDAGTLLAHFWETKVTSPKVAARKRKWYELAYRVIFNKWDGVVDTSPLSHLVHDVLGSKLPGRDQLVQVASVNLHTGQLVYTPSTDPTFLDAVLASTAEPVLMPLRHVKGEPHYDGGLRDITPLKRAIELGATRIVAVICQPEGVDEYVVREGHITSLVERALDIITNEIMLNDIDTLLAVNETLLTYPESLRGTGKRVIPLTVIQPEHAIGVSLESFTSADIVAMLKQGRADAERVLGEVGVAKAA